jgi:SnoaL-like domain
MAAKGSRRWIVLTLSALAILGVWLYPTDEKRVAAAAAALVDAANQGPAELSSALAKHAAPNARISVAELDEPMIGKDALVTSLTGARRVAPELHFRLESVEVTVEGNRARVSADLITMVHPEVPELRRPRHSTALFERRAGAFRLVSAEVGAARFDQPEARP